jgi:hypothetical protein
MFIYYLEENQCLKGKDYGNYYHADDDFFLALTYSATFYCQLIEIIIFPCVRSPSREDVKVMRVDYSTNP